MLHHHSDEQNTGLNSGTSSTFTSTTAPTYNQTATTSTFADREIIGDKIDRKGTYEESLPKHSHVPLASTASSTRTVSSSMTPIGSTSSTLTSSSLPATSSSTTTTTQVKSIPATVTPITTTVTPISEQTQTRVVSAPVQTERVAKPTVVHEHIIPIQKEEIQPVIYREREQLDVKQVTERLHETKIQPTVIENRNLAPEVRADVVMRGAPITPNLVAPSSQIEQTRSSTVVHAPIVQETIKRTVIEEVQPVLEREVIAPTIIKEVKPIYEKIVEAPRVFRETLPVRELGVSGAQTQFVESGFQHPNVLNQQPLLNQQAAPLGAQSSLTGKIVNAAERKLEQKQFENNTGLNTQSSSSTAL